MDNIPLKKQLQQLDQHHLLDYLETLNPPQKKLLQENLESIDFSLLAHQRRIVLHPEPPKSNPLDAFDTFAFAGDSKGKVLGQEQINQGKVACLILAGGEGTRLNFPGPKGLFPISVIRHKSLFQLFAEKTAAASRLANRQLPLAIMTSPQNDAITRRFFSENHYFGLSESQVSFFSQGLLPLLDAEGRLFLESPTKIAEGTNGNGFCFQYLKESGLLSQWMTQGVQYLNIVLIDNPLADPFDAELVGFHHQKNAEVTIKCTEKRSAHENVGVLVKENGLTRVYEYSELPDSEKEALSPDGKLKHRCANLSLFCFSLPFIDKVSTIGYDSLPLHKAWKAAKFLAAEGATKQSNQPMAWKFEAFIFDILTQATHIQALLYPREACFSPLKNASGNNSIDTVRAALQEYDRKIFTSISGLPSPQVPFELSQEFHYPTPDLLRFWKGRPLPNTGYINP